MYRRTDWAVTKNDLGLGLSCPSSPPALPRMQLYDVLLYWTARL